MSSGQFKRLMNHQDHGIKLLISTTIFAKRSSSIAYYLIEFFVLIGPPRIIQSDNAREISGMAWHSSDRDSTLDYQFIDATSKIFVMNSE